uniref:Uncharacterized protein n=1 Tax=Rhizophora mucronata TaxID=61149 RepID=A0A2P2QQX0_RHIMU
MTINRMTICKTINSIEF